MKRKGFIKILEKNRYDYTIKNNKIVVNHKGNVDLSFLKELPSGIVFNNGGNVYLPNQCKISNPKWKVIDNHLMENTSTKQINQYLIYATEYVGCKKQSYVAEFNGEFAHGKSIKDAIEDLEYKLDNRDINSTIDEVNKKGSININDFRKITGACRDGINQFLSTNPLPKKEMPINEALLFVEGAYGYDKLKEYFS